MQGTQVHAPVSARTQIRAQSPEIQESDQLMTLPLNAPIAQKAQTFLFPELKANTRSSKTLREAEMEACNDVPCLVQLMKDETFLFPQLPSFTCH